MGTITTSTQAQPFSYPNQSYMERSPWSGLLWTMVRTSAGALQLYSSNNNGTTWTASLSFTRANLQEWSGLYIDTDGFLHIAYRVFESGRDKIYYRRCGDVWDSEVLVASAAAASAGDVYQGVDVICYDSGGDYFAHIAVGTTSGANIGVTMFSVVISYEYDWWYGAYWLYTVNNNLIQGTRSWFTAGTGRVGPSLDFRHNSDGHTAGVPDLWVAFGRSTISVVRIAYSNGRWTGPGTAVNLATPTTAQDCVSARFDKLRFLVPVINSTKVDVYERDVSNTTTTVRSSPVHPTGVVRYVAINYVPQTGDFRLYAVGTSTAVLYYVDYARGTNSWGAWTSTALTIVNVNNFGTRRGTWGNSRYDFYTSTGSTPFTLGSTSQTLVFAPDQPITSSPVNGNAYDVAATLPITWSFTDIDPADTQSAYAIRRQIGGGTAAYWRASDSTWQPAEVQNTSSSTTVNLPAGWGLDADAEHNYKVKVWDAGGLASNYSDGTTIIPSTKVNPTITNPATTETAAINDTFTRTDAELIGDLPDLGGSAWAGSTGRWKTNGTQAEWVSGGSSFIRITKAGISGDTRASSESVTINTTATGAQRDFYTFTKCDATFQNYVAAIVRVDAAGNNTFFLIKVVGGVQTTLQTLTNALPSNAAYNFTLTVRIDGPLVRAWVDGLSIAGSYALSGTISAADVTAISLGTLSGFSSSGAATIGRFYVNQIVPQTVTASSITTTWTASSQSAFRVRLYEAIGPVLVHDSGVVNSAIASYTIPFVLVDNTTYRIDLQTYNSEGLLSDTQSITFLVDFIEPPTPTITVHPSHSEGVIKVNITNPAPSGGQPLLAGNDVYRRMIGTTGLGTRILADQTDNASIADFTCASGVDYEYRVLAKGVNGTSQYSSWSA